MARIEAAPEATRLEQPGARMALVCSGFHRGLTENLIGGARERLAASGLAEDRIDVHWVPGAYETPLAAQMLAGTGRYAAIIALGAVVRGSTPHFEHVCWNASRGLTRVSLDTGVPCTFGILTCDTVEQAWARAGGEVGNAGADAADAAVALVNLAAKVARL